MTFVQFILLLFALLTPKPSERWISLTRWNPELQYYLAFISQTILPAVQFVIIIVIIIGDYKDNKNDLTGPLVFACVLDAGIIF